MRGDGPSCGNEDGHGPIVWGRQMFWGLLLGDADNAGELCLVGVLGVRKGASVRHETIVRYMS